MFLPQKGVTARHRGDPAREARGSISGVKRGILMPAEKLSSNADRLDNECCINHAA